MEAAKIEQYGDELYRALRERFTVAPLTEREPEITIDDAYRIQLAIVARKLERERVRHVGKKIGVTSEVVQKMLAVDQPDFGHLTSEMWLADGDTAPIDRLIQPRAEGEIAFVLKNDVRGPGLEPADVLAATDCVQACFEIVDSRIHDWKIKIQDTIADNASSGMLVVAERGVSPAKVDLLGCRMRLEKNGEVVGTGTGAASMGSPVTAMTWLVNTLGERGITLRAGEIVLSGSLGPLVPAARGDRMRLAIEGIGECSVSFG
jgi:2-oxopent-4-enoate/cis-2-oxohex-4-enoate hydratase